MVGGTSQGTIIKRRPTTVKESVIIMCMVYLQENCRVISYREDQETIGTSQD